VSAISEAGSGLSRALPGGTDVSIVLKVLAGYFWVWFHNHRNETIIKKHLLVFNVTIKVKDLHSLFVLLFGQEPTPAIIGD
jgi:hypothetical protein